MEAMLPLRRLRTRFRDLFNRPSRAAEPSFGLASRIIVSEGPFRRWKGA
jgi:hypothetical protein